MQRYRIQQESIAISQDGVFRQLANRTGAGYCYASGHTIRLVDLPPYLPEAVDLYAHAMDEAPRLLPITSCYPLFANKQGWLRVEIDRDALKQRGIGPEAVTSRCKIFGDAFRLVQSPEPTNPSKPSRPDLLKRDVDKDRARHGNACLEPTRRYFPHRKSCLRRRC
jgi:hypothetical protein